VLRKVQIPPCRRRFFPVVDPEGEAAGAGPSRRRSTDWLACPAENKAVISALSAANVSRAATLALPGSRWAAGVTMPLA